MRKKLMTLLLSAIAVVGSYAAGDGRQTLSLNGNGWKMWLDKEAQWQNDKLYLPAEAKDLSKLPVNPPTGGWAVLNGGTAGAIDVHVPGTVEEFLTTSNHPKTEDFLGVNWWYRTLKIPADAKGKRVNIHFESVRMRAEVYLDGKLVAYDIVGESPFDADITAAVKPGTEQMLAVRVTNPGGNFHWQDFNRIKWGEYELPHGRCFSGLIGRVHIDITDPVYISDVYMQNTPDVKKVNAIITMSNTGKGKQKRDIDVVVVEKKNPAKEVFRTTLKGIEVITDSQTVTVPVEVASAKLWNIDTPELYVCKVQMRNGKTVADNDEQTFGFRWFSPEGIGSEAMLKLNGKRVMLRSAISWGYFPYTGLYATEDMAVRQVNVAKELGLNMLNFHRSIGSPVVLEAADSIGLLYYEEPGAFHSANNNPFIRTIVNEKLHRMIKRDRSHPSLVIYNLINEFSGPLSRDKALVAKRMNDMKIAHSIDPSRMMTFTSGWAQKENRDEDSKANMRPFDETLYMRGWWDNHRAGGPATWEQDYYKSPTDNFMFSDNHTEVVMRGEEGAISTPPRLEKINEEVEKYGAGWDGLFWQKQYREFSKFFKDKNLATAFGTFDNLTRKMGNVQLDHQGRRIQGMRMQNIGDAYVINGWESMPYDNHSGVVDIYRNPKGDVSVLAYYNQPLYVAVSSRSQIVKCPGRAVVDFYIVNEKDVKGSHTLRIKAVAPDGSTVFSKSEKVNVAGGDTYGQLLVEGLAVQLGKTGGMYRVEAELLSADGRVCATGHDDVLCVDWSSADMAGKGAYYGNAGDQVAEFYKKATGKELTKFTEKTGKLDWLVVNRSSFNEPELILPEFFKGKDGKSTLNVTWYSDDDMKRKVTTSADADINRTFAAGAQPDESLQANQNFSAVWEGEILPTQTGEYQFGIETDRGIRLSINDERLIDDWGNKKEKNETRVVSLEAGRPVKVRLEYRQRAQSGKIKLKWSQPNSVAIASSEIFDRAKNDGTTVILIGKAETWMKDVAEYTGVKYNGSFNVGKNWVGGVHFVKEHPLFEGLPVNDAMNWPYQAVVKDGDNRLAFRMQGEELVVGAYRSWGFNLGTSVGVIPCGKGSIVFSTLNIVDNLNNQDTPAEVARKLFCNYVKYSAK